MSQTEKQSCTFDHVHLAPNEQIGMHQQSTWELSYVITGAGMRMIGDMTEPFTSGEVILIPREYRIAGLLTIQLPMPKVKSKI